MSYFLSVLILHTKAAGWAGPGQRCGGFPLVCRSFDGIESPFAVRFVLDMIKISLERAKRSDGSTV